MNLFRSEAHARNWTGFGDEDGLVPLGKIMAWFSTPLFRERLNGEYITHLNEYIEETGARRSEILNHKPFWRPA